MNDNIGRLMIICCNSMTKVNEVIHTHTHTHTDPETARERETRTRKTLILLKSETFLSAK
jgi:hypothetical protein